MSNTTLGKTVSAAQLLNSGEALGDWTLDAAASTVTFAVKHLWGLVTVRGTFNSIGGSATVSRTGNISAMFTADATTIDTKRHRRDARLRSTRFFGAASHPGVAFISREVSTASEHVLRISGDLFVAGHARHHAFDATIASTPERLRAVAESDVDRTLFGMTRNPLRMTGRTAHVTVSLLFTHDQSAVGSPPLPQLSDALSEEIQNL